MVLIILGATGCKRLSTGAREAFAKEYSCPEERVTITERPDKAYGDLVVRPSSEEPPEEVKRDPGRLAKFRKDKAAEQAELRQSLNSNLTMFQGKGCGHDVLMGCGHTANSDGSADPSDVVCFIVHKP